MECLWKCLGKIIQIVITVNLPQNAYSEDFWSYWVTLIFTITFQK